MQLHIFPAIREALPLLLHGQYAMKYRHGTFYLPQGISVYPPNTYRPFLMMVTVSRFPSHLLWKVLTAQPLVEAR